MAQSNRPITSREYKLMLNADRFKDRRQGVLAFWNLVHFLVTKQNGVIIEPQNEEKRRRTSYLDTVGLDLHQHGFALRLRQESEQEEYKVTLKYRGPDRYISANQDLSSSEEGKTKFEEDILPPLISKFAHSTTVEFKTPPDLANVNKMVGLFPGLKTLNLPGDTSVETVNGFEAYEIVHHVGKIRFNEELLVKASLSFWYWLAEGEPAPPEDRFPLVAEFSFDYDAAPEPDEHTLENFPPQMVAQANRLFGSLQKQSGWIDLSGTTKTAFGYEGF